MISPRALLLCVVALVGCLPRQALSRRDEVEASVYALALDVAVVTEGAPVPPFRWRVEGTAAMSYARTFRDGSMGHLVRFEGLRGRWEHGGEPVERPVPFDGALLELRAFPDGELLLVRGISGYSGSGGHLEVLDAIWAGLVPHLPSGRREAERFTTSWPAWVAGGPRVRHRLSAVWTPGAARWSYEGQLASEGGTVSGEGRARGEVELGEGAVRLAAHRFSWERSVSTRWPTGARVVQDFRIEGSVTRVGAALAPPLDLSIASDDASADAQPLRLRDGRVVEDLPVDAARVAPFLLVPDDLDAATRAAVRDQIGGTW